MTNHDETCQFGPVTAALTPPFFLPPSWPHSSRSVLKLKHLSPLASRLASPQLATVLRLISLQETRFPNALNVSKACTLMSRPVSRLISLRWTSEDAGIGVATKIHFRRLSTALTPSDLLM
ncbi:hypothetical protein C8F01DRAFT_1378777 [Mycena amicta]|nr:hypothetical protein C8F01DRAFT_1378777 [Mycena amicta]